MDKCKVMVLAYKYLIILLLLLLLLSTLALALPGSSSYGIVQGTAGRQAGRHFATS